jgi:hypothetical protein
LLALGMAALLEYTCKDIEFAGIIISNEEKL